jgi:hypothetical protein
MPVHEWIWHEQHPGEDTRHNDKYQKFQSEIVGHCPELAWVRDVADASKHCGLARQAAKGMSARAIARELEAQKLPTHKGGRGTRRLCCGS